MKYVQTSRLRAFSLIELLVTVTIIAILASLFARLSHPRQIRHPPHRLHQ